jgi:hypothetical protein
MAFSTLRLAFQRAGIRRYDRDFLLRHGFARVLRKRSGARLRAFQADERSDAAKIASSAREVIKRSPNPINHEIPSRESRYASLTAANL